MKKEERALELAHGVADELGKDLADAEDLVLVIKVIDCPTGKWTWRLEGMRGVSTLYQKEHYDSKVREELCQMLEEALAVINDAIMHGMPVTNEIASLSNRIRGLNSPG